MTALEALLVLVTGFGAGVLSSTVGVASLLSFPVLVANAVADALYVAGGAWLWRASPDRPERAGAGAGIVVQGAFLCAHDTFHALRA